MATKIQEVKEVKAEVKGDKKVELKKLLVAKMPAMFDRNPDITGNLDTFVDEIINLNK